MSGISDAKIDIGAIRAMSQKALQTTGERELRFALLEINAMCGNLDKDIEEIIREKQVNEQLIFERGLMAGVRHGKSMV